jgi:hypothetical protein
MVPWHYAVLSIGGLSIGCAETTKLIDHIRFGSNLFVVPFTRPGRIF